MRYVVGLVACLFFIGAERPVLLALGKTPPNSAVQKIKRDMDYLCGERLQGRQTGLEGE